MIALQIPKDMYMAGLEHCKNHFHGIIILVEGDKPLTHSDLCKKMDSAWNSLVPWRAISFGKGYYEFSFSSLEDVSCVGRGFLETFSRISHDFCLDQGLCPAMMKLAKARCWIKIHSLTMEYWQPKVMFFFRARGIMTHLSMDNCTNPEDCW